MPVEVKINKNEDPDNSATTDTHPAFRVLVAEDDEDVRRITTILLSGAGYMVDEAQDGVEAWEAVQRNVYDLLVTDHSMPRMTGIDLLNKMHSAQIKTPAILVTGQVPTDELSRHPFLQIEAIILKPYTAVGLLAVVENIFSGRDCAEIPETLKPSIRPVNSPIIRPKLTSHTDQF